MPQKTDHKQNFLQGAMILTVATVLVKILMAVYKIPLFNLIGTGGTAHFNMAYSIYNTLFVVSTAGLPVAVSKMVAEAVARHRDREKQVVFRIALTCFVVIGLAGTCLLYLGAQTVAGWMGFPEAAASVRAIAPTVLFVAVMSAFRGYYQGHGDMRPTAVSQVIESIFRLGIGLILAFVIFQSFVVTPDIQYRAGQMAPQMAQQMIDEAASKGMSLSMDDAMNEALDDAVNILRSQNATPGALLGTTLGAAAGAVYLMLSYRRRRHDSPLAGISQEVRPRGALVSNLLRLAIPITISSSVLTLTNLIDNAMVKHRLISSGCSPVEADHLFGSYGYAQAIFNVAPALILSFSVSAIPAISAALARNDRKTAHQTIKSSLRITTLVFLPAAAGLVALAWPIINMLYGSAQPESVPIASRLLITLGLATPFVCLVPLTNAILQSLGLVSLPIVSMIVGGVFDLVIDYVLVGNSDIRIYGAPVGTLACYAAIAIINLFFIIRATRTARFLGVFVKPLAASAVMGAFAYAVNTFLTKALGLGNGISVILTIGVAVVFYLFLVIMMRALPKEDLLLIPKGDKLIKWLRL